MENKSIWDYYLVDAESVQCDSGFVPAHRYGSNVLTTRCEVGANRGLRFFSPQLIADQLDRDEWLVQENERLRQEVEDLQIQLDNPPTGIDAMPQWKRDLGKELFNSDRNYERDR